MSKIFLLLLLAPIGVFASSNASLQATFVKHLNTSRDFTLKVAEAMPAADYDYKLTPAQMSFGQQMVHLSEDLTYFLTIFSGEKNSGAKPKSKSKQDVMAFVKASFDDVIDKVGKLTPEQMDKIYKGPQGPSESGTDLLLLALDHTTHHRASAEMYLRAKGIKPPEYVF